jgi:hypothetical protein
MVSFMYTASLSDAETITLQRSLNGSIYTLGEWERDDSQTFSTLYKSTDGRLEELIFVFDDTTARISEITVKVWDAGLIPDPGANPVPVVVVGPKVIRSSDNVLVEPAEHEAGGPNSVSLRVQ